jgi:DNA-binding NarL/FixJ family response regulator
MAGTRRGHDDGNVTGQEPTAEPVPDLRILVVDDHPALRAGLQGLLRGEPGIECVGALDGTGDLTATVAEARPDVVVLDYALGDEDGLTVCFRLKQLPDPPAVVLYSAYVDRVFAVPAAMAQADAAVPKSAPVGELLSTIRRVGYGVSARPVVDRELMEAASARVRADDLPIAGMLLGAAPVAEIAATLDLSVADVRSRALRIIGRLQAGPRAEAAAHRS